VALGVAPAASAPIPLLAEIPHSIMNLNPEVFFIGFLALVLMFGLPALRTRWLRRIPAPMLVLVIAIPLGLLFDLEDRHVYQMFSHTYTVGPNFLIQLPGSLLAAITFPDFSAITSAVSIKYIVMFTLVGSIESLLTVSAVDTIDPERQTSDINKDFLSTGIANTIAAFIGGTPMISEIVRSKANIDNGAKTSWANFFHGAFLLLSLTLIPGIIQEIPQAALAAMLIYTGYRLASPKEFAHVYHIGLEQLALFTTTLVVTLATDLLMGVGAGLVLKVLLHLKNGARFKSLFRAIVQEQRDGGRLILEVHEAAIFTNFLGLKKRLESLPPDVKTVEIDFEKAWLVDHTVLDKLDRFAAKWTSRRLILTGLDGHTPMSEHALAARKKSRQLATASTA
jgi:MFS superfamily sulfate permease-like transporter